MGFRNGLVSSMRQVITETHDDEYNGFVTQWVNVSKAMPDGV